MKETKGPLGKALHGRLLSLGADALSGGRRDAALAFFEKAADADPSDPSAYLSLLGCHLAAGDLARARCCALALRRECAAPRLAAAAAALRKAEKAMRRGAPRTLLVCLGGDFESRLFALSFLDEAARLGFAPDLLMPRRTWFSGLEPNPARYGERLTEEDPGLVLRVSSAGYRSVVFCCFPETRYTDLFASLLGAKGPSKIFVNLRLAARRGDSVSADISAYRKLFSVLDRMYVLDNDSVSANLKYGVRRSALSRYPFSVNTDYYAPGTEAGGGFLLAAGTTDRDYPALFEALKGAGAGLRIYTDAALPGAPRRPGVEIRRLSGAHQELREDLRRASAVVIPTKGETGSCPNSILTMAMSAGRVTLTRRSPGLRALVKDGVTGFFYDGSRPGDLGRQVRRLLALDGARKSEIGALAREAVLGSASYSRLAAAALSGLPFRRQALNL